MKNSRRNNENQTLSEVLKDFISVNNLEKGIDEVQVIESWKKIMGPAIANYTSKIKFVNNTLYVELSSSVLKSELSYGTSKIIKNLNEDLGREVIQKLVMR